MSKLKQTLGDRVFAGLLRLLPFDFRSEFGNEMEEVFREQRAETVPRKSHRDDQGRKIQPIFGGQL